MKSNGSPPITRTLRPRPIFKRAQRQEGEPAADIPVMPFDAIPFVVRQRTKLQRLVSREYFDLMSQEFMTLKPFLPATAARVLDIGGGLGGADIFISRHYAHQAELHMLDRVGMDPEMRFGFRASTEKYNDPNLTLTYLKNGGVPDERFMFWDADSQLPQLIEADITFDVIISLKSWAFHYPYSVYADLVSNKLSRNGVMIIDVRNGSDQEDEIKQKFDIVGTAASDAASSRLVMKHAGSAAS
jgi:hypothetical protein